MNFTNFNENITSNKLKRIFFVLWIINIVAYAIFLFNPYFSHSIAYANFLMEGSPESILLIPNYLISMLVLGSFFYIGLSNNSILDVADTNNKVIITIYTMLLFFMTCSFIVFIFSKRNYLKRKNKLRKSITYISFSFLALILAIIAYRRGMLVEYNEFEFYYKRSYIPIIFVLFILLLDIPYLVVGIKEHKKNKELNITKNNFYDLEDVFIFSILLVTPIIFILVCLTNGGINFIDVTRVFIN